MDVLDCPHSRTRGASTWTANGADSSATASRWPVYSRRPGDHRIPGAALCDGDPNAGADQLGGSGRPDVVLSGAFGSRTEPGVRKANHGKGGADQPTHMVDSRPAGKPATDQPWRAEGGGATRHRFSD